MSLINDSVELNRLMDPPNPTISRFLIDLSAALEDTNYIQEFQSEEYNLAGFLTFKPGHPLFWSFNNMSEVTLQYTGEVCKMWDTIEFNGYRELNIADHYNFENRDWEPMPSLMPGVTDADFRELGKRNGYEDFWSKGNITIEAYYRFRSR